MLKKKKGGSIYLLIKNKENKRRGNRKMPTKIPTEVC
jgi:hypothetical protein